MSKASASFLFLRHPHASRERDLASEANWSPNTDIYVTDDGLVVKVELAGMRREDLELTVEGRLLKISGQRPDGCRTAKCTFLAMDINYGAFERVIELVGLEDEDRQAARQRWKHYATRGYAIARHDLGAAPA